MKKMIQFSAFALSGLLFLSPAPAVAQAASPEQVQQFIGNVMNQYATLSGGWFLEKKCHFLTAEQLKEYESDIAYTTVALNRELGVNNRLITQMQLSAQSITTKQQWGCDEKGRGIVNTTVGMAKRLHVVLAQIAEKRAAAQQLR